MNTEISSKIKKIISSADVALFMKGTKEMPMCGFSSFVVNVLKNAAVEFTDINVLEEESIRSGIKEFSDWPTIPQLYVKKEFIGGCDIVKEMHDSGDLYDVFKKAGIAFKKPD